MRYSLPALALLITAGCATTGSTMTPPPAHEGFQPPGYVRGNKDTKADRVIIFIHGVFGDGKDTWTNQNGAYFPQLLRDDPTFDGADIWVHDFPSPKLGRTYSIDELGSHLRKHLSEDNVLTNHREIVFVAHSMGGIITRAFLIQHRELTPDRIAMLYFFSTPTTGSEVANLARLFSNNPQLVDLRPMMTHDAGILGVYQNHWLSSSLRTIPTYCAYELLPTKGVQVVQRASATNLCTMPLDPINRDHLGIVKPANNDTDESYRAFRSAYRDRFERGHNINLTPAWNLQRRQQSLVEARNVTQSPFCENECWSPGVIVAPGDLVNIAVSYANDSFITARDTRVRLAVPQTPIFMILPLTGTLSATNVPPAHGQVGLMALVPVLLVPTTAWRQRENAEDRQPLPYTQSPAQVLTEGLRLGDIGKMESGRVIVQFRCEPATIAAKDDDEQTEDEFLKKMANLSEEEFLQLLTPSYAGRTESHLWGTEWISEVHDVPDDDTISAMLFHFNNTDTVQRGLQAQISIAQQTSESATIHITLSDASTELRTHTVDVRFRPGTTKQLRFLGAARMPKTTIQMLAMLSLAQKTGIDPPFDDSMEFPVTKPGVIRLGDLPPQSSVSAVLNFATGQVLFETSSPTTALRTTLNQDVKHPLLQVSKEPYSKNWKTHIQDFRRGDPVAFTFYFKNTGRAIARDAHLRLQLTHDSNGIVAKGSMVAANADAITGTSRIAFGSPGSIRLYYDRAELYRNLPIAGRRIDVRSAADGISLGDLDPGEWGLLKVMYVTAPAAQDLNTACATTAAVPGKRIEFSIAIDNPAREPLRDVALRVRLDHLPQDVHSTISLSANGRSLVERTYQATTLGEPVVLRYRDAQVYTTSVGRHIDARTATEAPIPVDDVPPNGQLFVRLVYDVMAKLPEGCRGTAECPGVECVVSDLCQF